LHGVSVIAGPGLARHGLGPWQKHVVLSQAVLPPVPREKPDRDGFAGFQEILCLSHISLVGASFSGSSKLASVTSIVFAQSPKVSVVPQLAQKVLVTTFDEEYFAGTPSKSSKFLRKTTAQETGD
jgi:hypothetical protein